MIDPITAMSVATAAFNGLKQFVAAGRDLEDCVGQLSKWAGAMSDIGFLEQKAKNPPWYKSFTGSPEAEAMEIFAAKEKIEKQKQEILTMIGYMYGDRGQERYRNILREVKAQREKHAYRKEEIKQSLIEWTVGVLAVLSGGAILGVAIYFIGRSQGKWK